MNDRSLELWAQEVEAAAGIARALAGTAFVPSSLRLYDDRHNFDLEATIAQTAAAILTGKELGLGVMASLRSIDVIPPGTGAPALRAAALRGLLQQHGHDIWVEEQTDTRAVVAAMRAGSDTVQRSTWTIDRARKMGLRGFNNPEGQWRRQPSAMLVARATAEVARWIASDALLGLPYISEELVDLPEDGAGEIPALDGEASSAPPAAPRRPPARRRKSQAPIASLPAAAPVSPDPTPGDPPEGAAAGTEGTAAAPPEPIQAAQRAALWAGMPRIGLTGREEALAAISGWIGREVASSNALSRAEAGLALDALKAEEARRAAAADQDAAAELAEPPQEEQPE